MGFVDDYNASVWKQRTMNALYPPSGNVQLGDVLKYSKGTYYAHSTLADLGVLDELEAPLEKRSDKVKAWSVKSVEGVDVKAKIKGKAVPGVTLKGLESADAGAVVTMSHDDSFLLALKDVTTEQYANPGSLSGPLSHRFWRNKWDTSWLVVTEVWRPAHCTFLASSKAGAQFELKAGAKAKVKGIVEADLSTGFTIVSESSSQETFTDTDGTVPVFRAHHWLGTVRPSGRRGKIYGMLADSNLDTLRATPHAVLMPALAPVPFDPTA